MKKNQSPLRYKSVPDPIRGDPRELLKDRPVAIYYRQSGDAQLGNTSEEEQIEYFPVKLREELHWKAEILTIEDDAGVSGTLPADIRPGLNKLKTIIENDLIGTIYVTRADRLFRDETGVHASGFATLCKQHEVMILTDEGKIYNFHNDPLGESFREFIQDCLDADADRQRFLFKMKNAKKQLVRKGYYPESSVAPGYIIRKIYENEKQRRNNSPRKKFVVFEPTAQCVRTYFSIFKRCGYNLQASVRYIAEHGPEWPNLESEEIRAQIPDPKIDYDLHPLKVKSLEAKLGRAIRNHPSVGALQDMLTNPIYIGKFIRMGYTIDDPSLQIVDTELFLDCFNHVSKIGLDNKPNPNYKGRSYSSRHRTRDEKPENEPLLVGMIRGTHKGIERNAYKVFDGQSQAWAYALSVPKQDTTGTKEKVWLRDAATIDAAVNKILYERLLYALQDDAWKSAFQHLPQKSKSQIKAYQREIDGFKRQKEDTENAFLKLTSVSERWIELADKKTQECDIQIARLTTEIAKLKAQLEHDQALIDMPKQFTYLAENWERLTRDQHRIVAEYFIVYIEARLVENRELELVIHWNDTDKPSQAVSIPSRTDDGWTNAQTDHLLQLVANGASQLEIAVEFYERNWYGIKARYNHVTGEKLTVFPFYIRPEETVFDFLARVGEDGFRKASKGEYKPQHVRWSAQHLEQLQALIDAESDEISLAKAFPYRNLTSIRNAARSLMGQDYVIPGGRMLDRNDTYERYIERANGKEAAKTVSFAQAMQNTQEDDRLLNRLQELVPPNDYELVNNWRIFGDSSEEDVLPQGQEGLSEGLR